MTIGTPQCLVPAGDRCGEGIVWDADAACLWWTDINRFLIHRHDPATGDTRFWFWEEPVVALSLTDRPGTLLVALASRIVIWRVEGDVREDHGFALGGYPRVRLNDGRADPQGRFWIGSMKNNVGPDGEPGEVGLGEGMLFRVGAPAPMLTGIGIANTLCWSPDGGTFYFADTLTNAIDAYPFDAAQGTLGPGVPHLHGHPRGLPDGSAMDADGYLWNCRYGGGCILRIAPDGQVAAVIEMPVTNITTCTFGGPDLSVLYITTAAEPGERLSGGLYALDAGVRGMVENRVTLDG